MTRVTNDTLRDTPPKRDAARERQWDWLTALVPTLLMALIYYRWAALALMVTAVGGYLMAAVLLAWARRKAHAGVRVSAALLVGLLTAFCLPATAPWWLSALAGGLAAGVDALPRLCGRFFPQSRYAKPLVPSVLVAYGAVRLLFPSVFAAYPAPAQFATLDGVTAATPLATMLTTGETLPLWRVLFGAHAGAVGETCAVALLLGAGYLVLRRRARLIAPACMLASVALLSWAVYGAPLYSLLCGGVLLGALLLADRTLVPAAPLDGVMVGTTAGVVTVIVRCAAGVEGVTVVVVAVCVCGRAGVMAVDKAACGALLSVGFGENARSFKKEKISVDKTGGHSI